MIDKIVRLHTRAFGFLNCAAGDWFMALTARLAFSSVLLTFFWMSGATKVGTGFPGFLTANAGAYAQIVPPIAEAAGYDPSKISLLPWGLIVHVGAYAEFLLPLLIIAGLFTRLSALAMIGFIFVMTIVDIQFHGIGEKAIGAFFDRTHDSVVSDQRLLWLVPLIYLVLNGGGAVSLDRAITRLRS